MERIENFLKTYWWIWLILLLGATMFLIFGSSALGSFFKSVMNFISGASGIFLLWYFTFGRGYSKSWGVFRILGVLGVLFSVWILFVGPFDFGTKDFVVAIESSLFNVASLCLIFSLLLFVLGEIFLYMDNIEKSISQISNVICDSNNMTCPRCYGKGFVDLDDIKRLGKEKDWMQGFCQYCDGEGDVEKGKAKLQDPLRNDYSESDLYGN